MSTTITTTLLRSEKALEGVEVPARDGPVGKVKDAYFDDERWTVRYFVVDTGLWLSSRPVLLAAAHLRPVGRHPTVLAIDATQEQVKNSPSIDADRPVSRQHERQLHDYFGWPYYWGAAPYMTPAVAPAAAPPAAALRVSAARQEATGSRDVSTKTIDDERQPAADPHLRSAREVRGYHIEASDGSIGHVEDFLLDEQTWTIRYIIIDTRNWWPGRKVVVSPHWISAVRWADSTVAVALLRDEIKNAPEYDPSRGLTVEYAVRLDDYYARLGRKE